MSSKSLGKIYHPELEISLYLTYFSKEVSQLTDWQTYKKLTTIWTNILGNVSKKFQKIYHEELEISLYLSNFRKEVSQLQTDRHTRNSELLGISIPTSQEWLQKNSEFYLIQNWRYPYKCLILVRMSASLQTDRHTRNSELIGTSLKASWKCLQKISERYHNQNHRY